MRIEVGISSIFHLPSSILRPRPSPFERADSERKAEGTRFLAGCARGTGSRGRAAHPEDGIETNRVPTGREGPGDAVSDS